jgi:replicative DNA helicase
VNLNYCGGLFAHDRLEEMVKEEGTGSRKSDLNLKALSEAKLNFRLYAFQLSRQTRGSSKRPCFGPESGAIEQDADIVSLYRPEYYKIDEWDDDEACPLRS